MPSLGRNPTDHGDLSTVEHQANSKRHISSFSPNPNQRAASLVQQDGATTKRSAQDL